MERVVPLLIMDLHERHPGLTERVAAYYAEGASVCLSRHHESPAGIGVECDNGRLDGVIKWPAATDDINAAWANKDEATRDGAYAVTLAAVEEVEELVAIHRAQTRTGADYYVASKGTPRDDLENAYRLEVSGLDSGNEAAIRQRVLQKKEQTRRGECDLPALAAVVGFKSALVILAYVKDI